jgi:exonuclease III
MAKKLSVISYNLHGFNQGNHGVQDLMRTINPDVFMLQEHWLSPNNLHKLNSLSSEYFVYASSAITECVNSGPLVCRPFGGTAIVVNKKFASITTAIASSERFTVIKLAEWLFITVYLPSAGTTNRDLILTP